MKKYLIRVQRTQVQMTDVQVEANNNEEASALAEKRAEENPARWDWETEDDTFEAIDGEEVEV